METVNAEEFNIPGESTYKKRRREESSESESEESNKEPDTPALSENEASYSQQSDLQIQLTTAVQFAKPKPITIPKCVPTKRTPLEACIETVEFFQHEFRKLMEKSAEVSLSSEHLSNKSTNCWVKAGQILSHPNRKNIEFIWNIEADKKYFEVTDIDGCKRKYKGITKVLQDRFFTKSDSNPKSQRTETLPFGKQIPKNTLLEAIKSPQHGEFLCKCGGKGRLHGEIVHHEVKRFFDCYANTNTNRNMKLFFAHYSQDIDAPAMPDGCTLRFLHRLITLNLVPLSAEYSLYDNVSGIASSIDVLCVNVISFDIVAIELKTGKTCRKDFVVRKPAKFMKNALSHCVDTGFNRAAIQLIFYLMILQQRYELKIDYGYVMHACSREHAVFVYGLPRWLIGGKMVIRGNEIVYDAKQADQNRETIYTDICAHMTALAMQKQERQNKKRRLNDYNYKNMRSCWK